MYIHRKENRWWQRSGRRRKTDILFHAMRTRQSAKSPRVERDQIPIYAANGVDQWEQRVAFVDDFVDDMIESSLACCASLPCPLEIGCLLATVGKHHLSWLAYPQTIYDSIQLLYQYIYLFRDGVATGISI